MGLRVVAVNSEADRGSKHVREADESVDIGGRAAAESYLDQDLIISAAKERGVDAIHPGYGFLSENANFAQRVIDSGIIWVGPSPSAIEAMGDKVSARNLVSGVGVPVSAGTRHPLVDVSVAVAAAEQVGYPIMVKAAAGGGGIGMAIAENEAELCSAFSRVQSAGVGFFGSDSMLLEHYVRAARHVEVQVLGLADGRVFALGDRDCSVQRRHQKVVEEAPCSSITAEVREAMFASAVRAAQAVGYQGAGTVEYLVDSITNQFYFLEMNTRLQVEHPVTELVTGVDIVREQFRVAAGDAPSTDLSDLVIDGHAIEFRVCAEDPTSFIPSPGRLSAWREPGGSGIRVDSGYSAGDVVGPYYDSLLAKLCVHASTREGAVLLAREAVAKFVVEGVSTNLPFLARILEDPEFLSGFYDTGIVRRMGLP